MVKTKSAKTIAFEDALAKLEEVVRKLEGGDVSLDDSLKMFEDGTKLVRLCESKLNEAKGKVEMLMQSTSGETKLESFGEAE